MSTPTKLVVLAAFVLDEETGEVVPAFEPREVQGEERARSEAKVMWASGSYVGVIAWSRSANPNIGEYGEPEELFRAGEVPDLE